MTEPSVNSISMIPEELSTADDISSIQEEFSTVEINKREYAKSMRDINKKQRKRKKAIEEHMKANNLNTLKCGHGVSVVLKSVKRVKFDEKLLVEYLEVEDDYFEAYKNANGKERNTLSTKFNE